MPNINEKLVKIQTKLKCGKDLYSDFGGYSYRSKESLLEALKPLCAEAGCSIIVCDTVENIGQYNYVRAEAILSDGEGTASTFAYAREADSRPKMDAPQLTGTASSYAGKRALGNLFALDDTADSDSLTEQPLEQKAQTYPAVIKCKSCGKRYTISSDDGYQKFLTSDAVKCCPNPAWQFE